MVSWLPVYACQVWIFSYDRSFYSTVTFHHLRKMAWLSKINMDFTKKPKCELDFEKEYKAIQEKMSYQIIFSIKAGGKYGYGVQDYFPIQTSWVKPYLLEEKLGIAILQRCQRLVELVQHEQTSEPEQLSPPGSGRGYKSPPEYNSVVPSVLAEELQKLRGEYWKHQDSLNLLDSVKPINSPPVQEQMVLRKHRDRHGRSYAGVLGQDKCAASGGCRGRGCGCCEKALNQYLSPGRDRDLAQETKEAKVLGHCTVECRCCIHYRGCYIPDSRLPLLVL